MAILTAFFLFVLLLGTISYFGYRYYARPGRYYQQLAGGHGFEEGHVLGGLIAHPEGVVVRVFKRIGQKIPLSPEGASMTRRMLMAAGWRAENAAYVYSGIRAVVWISLPLLAFFMRGMVSPRPAMQVVFVAMAGLFAVLLPGFILDYLVARRQEELKLTLPDALDLLVVCVEAGLGIDQAIVSVARELAPTHKEISEELGLVSLEMQAGKRRTEALRNLADRTGEAEIRKLVAVLIQTDRFGTSMADSLRTHSDFMRVRRRQEAEERANKVSVKLVFPIFFCILPSMIVVVAGPGLIQIIKYLFPMLRNFKA